MKKLSIFVILAFACLQLWAMYTQPFLSADIAVNAGVLKVNGTDFTSAEIDVDRFSGNGTASLYMQFTRAAGSASTIDANFEVSSNGGATWATLEGGTLSVATNHSVISGTTVRVYKQYNLNGVGKIRLQSVKNNDASNNITAFNITLGIKS